MTVQINKAPGQRVIELGGAGGRHPAADVMTDIRGGPDVDFQSDLNELLPISSDEWDAVLSFYVLEHISYRRVPQFLSEVFRILKPGGVAILTTPNTAAQITWLQNHPEGWDERNFFNSVSGLLYGDQDYPDNSHKCYFDENVIESLFKAVGFTEIQVHPYGERETDLYVVAKKALPSVKDLNLGGLYSIASHQKTQTIDISKVPREELFGKDYFNGGKKYGGYAHEGYRDFSCHELTARKVLERNPTSVLELAAARGYVLKRIQDAGVAGYGYEISKHCYMTRACEQLYCQDVLTNNWHLGKKEIDLIYSMAFLEHVPEEHLDFLLEEHARVGKRGLHGIDFGDADTGFDLSHVTLRSKEWWEKKFRTHGIEAEIIDKEEMEKGEYPREYLEGDGKLKVQIGSHLQMFHNGWLNVDVLPLQDFANLNGYQFLYHDVRNGLPFDTESVHLMFTSHFLEHLDYQEGVKILKECRRVLRPDGALRIIVPNAFLLLNRFRDGMLNDYREINDSLDSLPTDLARLHELLYSNHKAIYDDQTLKACVEEAGLYYWPSHFRDDAYNGNMSISQMRRETTDAFPCLSLYAYAIPKT